MPRREQPRGERDFFLSQLELIRQVIRYTCARYHLFGDGREEFASHVYLKLIEEDYAILRKFRGESSLRTYLTAVVYRLFLDYQVRKRGKWRASNRARELGIVALRLERLIWRRGFSEEEAVEILLRNESVPMTRSELFDLIGELPRRQPLQFRDSEALEELPATEAGARRGEERERLQRLRLMEEVLNRALSDLPPRDRQVLALRFDGDHQVTEIARLLEVQEARPLYTRIYSSLRKLKRRLESEGFSADEVMDLLSWEQVSLSLRY